MPSSDPLPPLPADFALAASFDPFDGTAVHPVLDPLDSFYLPLARFRGVERPGPHVDVYLRRPEASAVPGARLDTSVGAR